MTHEADSSRNNELMSKVMLLMIVFLFEIAIFGLELRFIGKQEKMKKAATEMAITYTSGTLYIISALIFRRAAQFWLYPLIFIYTIVLAFLHPKNFNSKYLATKLVQVVITISRGLWILFFYRSFRNIFDWQNFLKYKSNEKLIGKCLFNL